MSTPNQTYPFIANIKNRPEVIAHRGGDGEWPGETIGAYENARSLGVDVIEMDIYLTGDQQLVLMHDQAVKKTTDGNGPVESYTCDEIQKLNAGYKWSREGEFPYQNHLADLSPELQRKLRVPKLSDVLEEFGDLRMIIEMKPAFASPAAKLWEMLQKYDMTDKVLVASFSDSYIDEFRDLSQGEVATSLSIEEFGEFVLGFHGFEEHSVKPCVIDAPYWMLTEHLINKIKERGYKVHAWTVNNAEEMGRMRDLEVDGIITDYPKTLLDILGRTPK
ncbi:MAG TPA: glycerophosphodiester phosphodiesterase [Pyrinomonadaceae bacterium]|nr:glycerophosphodiester phosphodiesterase [Pyrinomonadaceae bacterium]